MQVHNQSLGTKRYFVMGPFSGEAVIGVSETDYARAVSCVNACADMPDPAAEIAVMRAAIARANNSLFGSFGFFLSMRGEPMSEFFLHDQIEIMKDSSRANQQERDRLREANAELEKDAELYRKLRNMHWTEGQEVLVVIRAKNALLGTQTYTGELLDEAIAKHSAHGQEKGG